MAEERYVFTVRLIDCDVEKVEVERAMAGGYKPEDAAQLFRKNGVSHGSTWYPGAFVGKVTWERRKEEGEK